MCDATPVDGSEETCNDIDDDCGVTSDFIAGGAAFPIGDISSVVTIKFGFLVSIVLSAIVVRSVFVSTSDVKFACRDSGLERDTSSIPVLALPRKPLFPDGAVKGGVVTTDGLLLVDNDTIFLFTLINFALEAADPVDLLGACRFDWSIYRRGTSLLVPPGDITCFKPDPVVLGRSITF